METRTLAHLVASAHIRRLALIGLSKNVGKTTATNYLIATLLDDGLYHAGELALTSLGLDGEAIDALTGLPKPRYVPEAGMLVATTANLLTQAEREGVRIERLAQLASRTALGPVSLARILQPGRVIIAGPTLLRDLRLALDQFQEYGARLAVVDGAINRLGAAAPGITDACILCTGTSTAATPEQVARRTSDVLKRLTLSQSQWYAAYRKYQPGARLLVFSPAEPEDSIQLSSASIEPADEAAWIAQSMRKQAVFFLRGAFTEELSRELLARLPATDGAEGAELVVEDGTKLFSHAVTLERLAERRLRVRSANPIRVLALTINPFTPEYPCTPQRLLDALLKVLPEGCPPVFDVRSGLAHPGIAL